MVYVIVAHPDDETIFFSSILQRKKNVTVICVTDGNADGNGIKRKNDFEEAVARQGATPLMFKFKDIYNERIDITLLEQELKKLPLPQEIYTHGILGEYGHPHHQDVSYCVHKVFKEIVFSTSYNTYPKELNELTEKEYELKKAILTTTYLSETINFSNILPITSTEGFIKASFSEVEHLYQFFLKKEALDSKKLDAYKHLFMHLNHKFKESLPRLF